MTSHRLAFLYIIVSLLIFSGCASDSEDVAPSENKSLNAVSPTQVDKPKPGYMQQAYDSWEKDDWAPNTKKTATVAQGKDESNLSTSKDTNSSKEFKLQNYVEKWQVYSENKEKNETQKPSNVEKLNALPVIGN